MTDPTDTFWFHLCEERKIWTPIGFECRLCGLTEEEAKEAWREKGMITYKQLKELVKKYPNDMELGKKIRKLYWRSADRVLEKEELIKNKK